MGLDFFLFPSFLRCAVVLSYLVSYFPRRPSALSLRFFSCFLFRFFDLVLLKPVHFFHEILYAGFFPRPRVFFSFRRGCSSSTRLTGFSLQLFWYFFFFSTWDVLPFLLDDFFWLSPFFSKQTCLLKGRVSKQRGASSYYTEPRASCIWIVLVFFFLILLFPEQDDVRLAKFGPIVDAASSHIFEFNAPTVFVKSRRGPSQ